MWDLGLRGGVLSWEVEFFFSLRLARREEKDVAIKIKLYNY